MPESTPPHDTSSSSPFRKGVPLLLGIVWNAPLAAVLVLVVRGDVTPQTAEFLFGGWAATIPVFAVALAVSARLQRLLLRPSVDVSQHRPKLWGVAALWTAILAFWIASNVIMRG